jgi:hypothetical protein
MPTQYLDIYLFRFFAAFEPMSSDAGAAGSATPWGGGVVAGGRRPRAGGWGTRGAAEVGRGSCQQEDLAARSTAACASAAGEVGSAASVVVDSSTGMADEAAADEGAADEGFDEDGDGLVVFFGFGDTEGAAADPLRRADVFCVVPGESFTPEAVALCPYTSVILILKGPRPAPPSMTQ